MEKKLSEDLVISYVNSLFSDYSSVEKTVDLLNKIGLFFDKHNYEISNNTILNLLANNINLYNGIEYIVNEHKDNIEKIINNSNSLKIIKTYCKLNTVESSIDNIQETDFSMFMEDNLKLYFNDMKKRQLLTPDEERYLIYKIKSGDEEAKAKFLESNLRLVIYIARSYLSRGVEFLDLIQEGNVGLIIALERFDPSMGCKFSTYATPWIRREIIRFIITKNKNANNIISLNYLNPVDNKTLEDKLHDEEWTLEEEIEKNDLKNIFNKILSANILTVQELEFIKLKYGFYDDKPFTLEEIGKMNNVSRQRVKQVIEKALRKIKKSEYMEVLLPYKCYREQKPLKVIFKATSIYDYMNGYTKSEVDEVIKGLSERELNLIKLRYGDNYSSYNDNALSLEDANVFYCGVVPKIKKLLKEQRG